MTPSSQCEPGTSFAIQEPEIHRTRLNRHIHYNGRLPDSNLPAVAATKTNPINRAKVEYLIRMLFKSTAFALFSLTTIGGRGDKKWIWIFGK